MGPDPIRTVSLEEEEVRTQTHTHTQRENPVRTPGETAVYMPRREVSGGTSPAHTWVSDSSPQDWGQCYMLFKPLWLWCFVSAA